MRKCITITRDQINYAEEIYLHDAEIREIMCNYFEKKVLIPFVLPTPNCGKGSLEFKGIAYTEISCHEPWGAGYYILDLSIESKVDKACNFHDINDINQIFDFIDENDCFKIVIELNSGDKINIIAREMTYIEE